MVAKPYVCDTWQGLHVGCCGVLCGGSVSLPPVCVVLAEVVWNGLP